MLLALAVCLILPEIGPTAAEAHSLYIQAGRYHVVEGKSSPLFFCYGHHLPVDDAVRSEKLANVRVHAPGGGVREVALRPGKELHSYLVDYDAEGTWALSAATNPGFFSTWFDASGRKRHSIKPLDEVLERAASVESSLMSWQWTKTYVTCGAPSVDFPAVLGQPLELAPMADPALLRQGDTLLLRVYADGKPLEEPGYWDATYMGFSTEAEDMYAPRAEVADGLLRLTVDVPGRWFVRFYTKTPAPEELRGRCTHVKRTATLVFEVRNERRNPEMDSH
jgi:uncharacterized GH25 family protein